MGKASRKKQKHTGGFTGVRGHESAYIPAMTGRPSSFGKPLPVPPPKWEGTYSFEKVWHGCERQLFDAPPIAFHKGMDVISGTDVVALAALRVMQFAHPIYIGTEQFESLPGEIHDLSRFIEDIHLPFPWVYLDFSSARGPAGLRTEIVEGPELDSEVIYEYGGHQQLAGALMGHFGGDGTTDLDMLGIGATAANGFTVIPFGTTFVTEEGQERGPNRGDGVTMDTYAPLGLVSFGTHVESADCVFGKLADVNAGDRSDVAYTPLTVGMYRIPVRDTLSPPADLPGTIITGSTHTLRERLRALGIGPGEHTKTWIDNDEAGRVVDFQRNDGDKLAMAQARIVFAQAMASLRAIYLLNAQNVEVGDADLPRQVRRNAERKGYGIAKVVRVRRAKIGERKPPSGNRRNFSHRFERRGHFHHVRRGPAAKPDHITPCYRRDVRTGEPTCPDGCRKVWIPPTWVGDESLVMVPKTRIWPGQDDVNDEAGAA